MRALTLFLVLIAAATCFAGSSTIDKFTVDGTTLRVAPSNELSVDTATVTATTDATVTANKAAFVAYTTIGRPKFSNYSVGAAVCWKADGNLSYCQTTPTDGACTCK